MAATSEHSLHRDAGHCYSHSASLYIFFSFPKFEGIAVSWEISTMSHQAGNSATEPLYLALFPITYIIQSDDIYFYDCKNLSYIDNSLTYMSVAEL